MFSSWIYESSPIWLQEAFISAREYMRVFLREGGSFRRIVDELSRSERLSSRELLELESSRTVETVQHAAKDVPYYRRLFNREGIAPEDIRTLDDVQRIPYLTKSDAVANAKDLVAEHIGGLKFTIRTSGSTGTPLVIAQSLAAIVRENAFIWRQLSWAGFQRGEPRAWLRGDMIVPAEQRDPPLWRMNYAANMLMMSSYHMSDSNAATYVDKLESFDPVVIQAYPSSIALLANYLESQGRDYRGKRLRSVITSSETLREDQEGLIRKRLGCAVFDYYGAAERVALICMCEAGNRHLICDYGHVELLKNEDGFAEIVGTGFNNKLMPFVRYKTGDLVVAGDAALSCGCGRHYPVVHRVMGRMDDYILTADGRKITRLGHVFAGLRNISEAQLVQERIGEVCALIVPTARFCETDQAQLKDRIGKRMGRDVKFSLRIVSQIPRGHNGKMQLVVRQIR